jgi:FkbM family methyltransferase
MNLMASLPLKRSVQFFLKNIGLYERLKMSRVYDFYWSFVDPHWLADRAKEVEFYRTTLSGFQKGNIIFDIGANDGYKTDVFLRLGAKVVAVEPDDANIKILKGKFLENRIFPRRVTVEGKAVSDRGGQMTMWIDAPGSALNTLNPKWADTLRNNSSRFGHRLDFAQMITVLTTTLENLIGEHGVPFYIKIDVEGHEQNALRGLNKSVPYISFEVNLPEFREEGLKCIRLLTELNSEGEFNYVADCRRGLARKSWRPSNEFVPVFEQCREPVVEIFWRSPERFQFNSPRK